MPSPRVFTFAILTVVVSACAPSAVCRERGLQPGTAAYGDCVQGEGSFQMYNYNHLGTHPNP